MPKDARLGLVVGVGLVIIIAVLFYRGEPAARLPTGSLATGRSGYPVNASAVQASAFPGSFAAIESADLAHRPGGRNPRQPRRPLLRRLDALLVPLPSQS